MAAPRRKVDSLEDILQRYGVQAHYGPVPEDPVPASTDERANDDALFRDVLTSSADWQDEFLAASDTTSKLPLYVSLGDIRTEHGQRDAALKAYEAAVLEEDDAQRLCELGYLLLQRCRVDELPLCDRDFDGSRIDFASGETLFISSYLIDPENAPPEFPDKLSLLDLAIRAFGLAHAGCLQRFFAGGASWEDWWHELVALEGLRAAFLAADNLDALDSVRSEYYGWVEDIEEAGGYVWNSIEPFVERFEANFRETEAYLRGRRKAVPLQEPSESWRHLVRHLLRSELEPVRGDLQAIRDLGEAAHSRLDLIVERLIDLDQRSELTWEQVREWAKKSPEAEKAKVRDRLEAALGDIWSRLQPESQEDLIDAEVVLAECSRIGSAWRCAAIGYCVAAERELKRTVEYLTGEILTVPSGEDETLGQLIVALTGPVAWARKDKRLSKAARLILDAGYIKRLEDLNRIRIRAAHSKKPKVSHADVLKVQELLLHPRDEAKPLLPVIVQAGGALQPHG